MAKDVPYTDFKTRSRKGKMLKFLRQSEIEMIDEVLESVGEFGEVRLIVHKGRLRFVVTQQSHDAFHWQPGSME